MASSLTLRMVTATLTSGWLVVGVSFGRVVAEEPDEDSHENDKADAHQQHSPPVVLGVNRQDKTSTIFLHSLSAGPRADTENCQLYVKKLPKT